MQERIQSHYASLDRIIGFTRVADAKAAPIVVLQTALAGTLASQSASLAALLNDGPWDVGRQIAVGLFIAYIVTSASALALAGIVYRPMTPKAQGSLIYFEYISSMESDAFIEASTGLEDAAIESQLLDQIWRVSKITSEKFWLVRAAVFLSGPSFLTWATLLALALA